MDIGSNKHDFIKNLFIAIPITSTNTVLTYVSDSYADFDKDPQAYSPNPKIGKIPKISIEVLDKDGNGVTNIDNIYIELTVYTNAKLITQA